ncbi:hypothetical protein IFM89_015759, partial [Coptis chinensis]
TGKSGFVNRHLAISSEVVDGMAWLGSNIGNGSGGSIDWQCCYNVGLASSPPVLDVQHSSLLSFMQSYLDLVDIEVFHEAKKVIDALHNKDVAPALAWCADNKSRLKKSKSKLEFQLRLQEFVEL